ncbi:unnamed protein product [Ectocarpus sp. 12 AP-2014]
MDSKGHGSRRKSRGRRRMEDLLRGSTAVAPSLQPYVAGAGAVETGLYRFLSPITIQASLPPAAAGQGGAAGGVGGGAAGLGGNGGASLQSQLAGHATSSAEASPTTTTAGAATAAAAAVLPPNWYRAGRGVDDLLNEAEGLDWLADSGGAVAVTSVSAVDPAAAAPAPAPAPAAGAGAGAGAGAHVGVARVASSSELSSQPLLKKVRSTTVDSSAPLATATTTNTSSTAAAAVDGIARRSASAAAMTPSSWSLPPPRPVAYLPPAAPPSPAVVAASLTPSGLQGSDAEEEHLSGLSDLESLMEDQVSLPGSHPFGPVSTAAEVAGAGGDDMDDGMVDEDAFVDALLDA